jgi:hypothetical protein
MIVAGDADTRALALKTIGELGPANQELFDALVRGLGDQAALVRRTAAEALGSLGSVALEPVVRVLSEPELEEGALLALGRLPVAGVAPAIRDYARAQTSRALHCVDMWQGLGEPKSDEHRLLLESLMDEAQRRATRALQAIAPLGDSATVALALDALSSRDPSQRANALEALDNHQEHALIRPLLRVWETPAATVQTDGVPAEVLSDPDPWIRACAALVVHAAESRPYGEMPMETLPAVSVMERVVFLRRVPLFAKLAPIEVKQVAAIAGERIYTDGDVLCSQGEPGDEMYVIVSGEVRVIVKRSDGTAAEAVRRGAGEYVGEMAILTDEPRIATLVAVGTVRTLTIGQKDFERILRERPETGLAVIRELCARLNESETRTTHIGIALGTSGY